MEGSKSTLLVRTLALLATVLVVATTSRQVQSASVAQQSAGAIVEQLQGQLPAILQPVTGTGYSLIGPTVAADGWLPLNYLGQQQLPRFWANVVAANKRSSSRRMSSFMPMRGRRDGDGSSWQSAYYPSAGRQESSGGSDSVESPDVLYFSPTAHELESAAGGGDGIASASGLMQAKLRRAFHPMRGKKSASMGEFNLDEQDI